MVFHQWKSSLERLIVFQKVSEAVRVKQKLVLAFMGMFIMRLNDMIFQTKEKQCHMFQLVILNS